MKKAIIVKSIGVCLLAAALILVIVKVGLVWVDEQILNKENYQNLEPSQLDLILENRNTLTVTCAAQDMMQQPYAASALRDVMSVNEWNVQKYITHSSDDRAICIYYYSDDKIIIYDNDTAYATYLTAGRSYRIPNGTYDRLVEALQVNDKESG